MRFGTITSLYLARVSGAAMQPTPLSKIQLLLVNGHLAIGHQQQLQIFLTRAT